MRRFFALFLCLLVLTPTVRGDSGQPCVALTFDDGPSGRFTRRLLDGLQERDVKATFLLCGYRLELYPDEARRIHDEGHEIGIHGYSHKTMCDMTAAQVTREIRDTFRLLPEGCHPIFFRPPGGLCGAGVSQAAKKDGLAILSWSVDPQDWATRDKEQIVRYVVSRARDGDIILLHDLSDASVDAAFQIIEELREKGFLFVTATELAQRAKSALTPGISYRKF